MVLYTTIASARLIPTGNHWYFLVLIFRLVIEVSNYFVYMIHLTIINHINHIYQETCFNWGSCFKRVFCWRSPYSYLPLEDTWSHVGHIWSHVDHMTALHSCNIATTYLFFGKTNISVKQNFEQLYLDKKIP